MKKKNHPAVAAACALALAAWTTGYAGESAPAMGELMTAAGKTEITQVPNIQGAPMAMRQTGTGRTAVDNATVACVMSVRYEETVRHILFVRFWKTLEGTANVRCDGGQSAAYALTGEGLSLGVGIPSDGPFSSTNGGIAGSIQIRLPHPFHAAKLAGTYLNAGGEVLGGGVSFSPWVNTDASFNAVIYLPTSFNASAAVNLQSLTLSRV